MSRRRRGENEHVSAGGAENATPGWGDPDWLPVLRPGRIEFESHQALRRIVAGLIDDSGRMNPEGPRQRLTEFDLAVLAHEAAMGCPTPAR